MSKEAHAKPLLLKVAAFHSAFMKSISHFGRSNELEFMGLYQMENVKKGGLSALIADIKSLSKLGIAMLRKKRMHFKLDKTKGRSEITALYNRSAKRQGPKE
ncbi:MAG TPA: hypothetical protein ENH45_02025 [Nitrospirae bacterium]|nr:hypothetical protein [Nitrospirota bacterium]